MLTETDRYDRFRDKIITPPLPLSKACTTRLFSKEAQAKRQVIEYGLRVVQARHGDIYMHGDLDELSKLHIVLRLKNVEDWNICKQELVEALNQLVKRRLIII